MTKQTQKYEFVKCWKEESIRKSVIKVLIRLCIFKPADDTYIEYCPFTIHFKIFDKKGSLKTVFINSATNLAHFLVSHTARINGNDSFNAKISIM